MMKTSFVTQLGWGGIAWRRLLPLELLLLTATQFTSSAAPIVTVIDDDAHSVEAIQTVKNIGDRCGIKITFAAIAAYLERKPEVTNELRKYEEEGHEIASHSLTHNPAIWKVDNAINIQSIEHEVIEAEEVFRRLALHPKSFVYPYGKFPSNARKVIFDVVGRFYPVAFNACGDINLPQNTYPLYISRHPLRKHNSMFMTKKLIDQAVSKDKSWLVILSHSANSDFSAERLEKTIRYAQESGAIFLPASEAWEEIKTWTMIPENQISDYSRLADYANALYFHLPLLLVCGGIAFAAFFIGMIFFHRRVKGM